jgi:hypothetical protein
VRAQPLARYVASLLDTALCRTVPTAPLDLNAAAKRLGAVDVLYRVALMTGFTDWSGRRPVIQVGFGRSDGRRRATLAHECGHLLLDPILQPPSYAETPEASRTEHHERISHLLGAPLDSVLNRIGRVDIEALCDLVSIELMIPHRIIPELQAKIVDLDSLRESSSALRVSLSMLTNRVSGPETDLSLLRMVPTAGGRWISASVAGLPWRMRGRITWEDVSSLDLSSGRGRTRTVLTFNGDQHKVDAEVRMYHNRALLLIHGLHSASQPELVRQDVSGQRSSLLANEDRHTLRTADCGI